MTEDVNVSIRAALDELRISVEITREFRQLRDSRHSTIQQCLKERPDLANLSGIIPRSWFEDTGTVGRYVRAKFYLLYQLVRAPKISLAAAAGSGKTRGAIESLRDWAGRVIWVKVPTHKMIRQVAEDFRKQGYGHVYEVYGRAGLCQRDDPNGLSRQISALGLDVQGVLCGNPDAEEDRLCPHYAACSYQQQRAILSPLEPPADEPLVLVMATAYLVAWPSFLPEPDLLVVDEKHWDIFVHQGSILLSTLKLLLQSEFQRKHPDAGAERVLSAICGGIASNDGLIATLRQRGLIKPRDFRPLLESIKSEIDYLSNDLRPDMDELQLNQILGSPRLKDLGTALSAIKALQREVQGRGAVANEAHSISYPDTSAISAKTDRVGIHFRRKSPATELPALFLDASADDRVGKVLWGKGFQTEPAPANRNVIILQVRERSFSRRSIQGDQFGRPYFPEPAEKLRGQTEGFLLGRAAQHEKLLVVAQKQVEERWLQPWLETLPEEVASRIHLAHFGALRGRNDFKDCDAVVIIGREMPSPGAVAAQARALLFDSSQPLSSITEFDRLSATRKFVGGEEEQEFIFRHRDPFIDALREQICERESEQAMDRLRLIHNDYPKVVYLLSSHPTRAEVTVSAPWKHFLDPLETKVGRAIEVAVERCAGLPAVAFPVGYKVLAATFPSIFDNEIQARHNILENTYGHPEKVPLLHMVLLFGNGVPFIVKYRKSGQRRPSRAVVFFPTRGSSFVANNAWIEEISKAALEKVVGPVTILKIESYPGTRFTIDPTAQREENQS